MRNEEVGGGRARVQYTTTAYALEHRAYAQLRVGGLLRCACVQGLVDLCRSGADKTGNSAYGCGRRPASVSNVRCRAESILPEAGIRVRPGPRNQDPKIEGRETNRSAPSLLDHDGRPRRVGYLSKSTCTCRWIAGATSSQPFARQTTTCPGDRRRHVKSNRCFRSPDE